MKKVSPSTTRKNMKIVHELVKAGIDFVPIPALDNSDKNLLYNNLNDRLEYILTKIEKK